MTWLQYKLTFQGGLMLNLLFVPGLSMVAGGSLYPNQKFNPVAAGTYDKKLKI